MTQGSPYRRTAQGLALASVFAWTAVILGWPEATRSLRPYFYWAYHRLSPEAPLSGRVVALSTRREPLDTLLLKLAASGAAVVAMDPGVWSDAPPPDAKLLARWRREVRRGSTHWVMGYPLEEKAVLPEGERGPIPQFPTLEGTLEAQALPSGQVARGALEGLEAPFTAGFSSCRWTLPAFEAPTLARQFGGLAPSLGLEALRRGLETPKERLAYVPEVGLLFGKNRVLPLGQRGMIPLKWPGTGGILQPASLLWAESPPDFRDKILFVGPQSRTQPTLIGARPTVEMWAVLTDNALQGLSPRTPSTAGLLGAGIALLGTLGLLAAWWLGMGGMGLSGLGTGLALLYPLLAFAFYRFSNWWLPPEQTAAALLGSGLWLGLVRAVFPMALPPIPSHSPNLAPANSPPAATTAHSGAPAGTPKPKAAPVPPPPPPPKTPPAGIPITPPAAASRGSRRAERATPAGDMPEVERNAQGALLRIGRYRVVRKLGQGSAGEVFEGLDTQMGRQVALKTMTRQATLTFDHAFERFLVEARAAGSLNHPNINTIHDFGSHRQLSYMVMEYLDGMPLSQWMRSNPIPKPGDLNSWAKQIASALDYAHSRKVIHRDLKPGNLMVVDGGRTLKLLDFGVAKFEDIMLTQTGMTVGTPSYMSPEQLMGEDVDARSDQYSMAVVLYQMLSHKLPYAGNRIPEICNHILRSECIPLTEANPAVPGAVWETLRVSLRKNREDRYPSCADLAAAFERATATSPEVSANPASHPPI